jgi:serine phosphatase RsbU (regulator of sigma subunit)
MVADCGKLFEYEGLSTNVLFRARTRAARRLVVFMLKFDDFFHLPQLDELIAQLIADHPGLVVVAGLDPRPLVSATEAGLLPSGRGAVFRALVGAMLEDGSQSAVVIAERRDAIRMSRSIQRRVKVLEVQAPRTYADRISTALSRRPDLLVLDRLDDSSAPAAFVAAREGLRVVAQLDTVCHGADVARHLHDLGVPADDLAQLSWVVSVERMPRLCPHCVQPVTPDADRLARLHQALHRTNDLQQSPHEHNNFDTATIAAFDAHGCEHCEWSGRQGDVAIFDIYHAGAGTNGAAALPLEQYMWQLVQQGMLALDDLLGHDAERLYRTYRLLSASAHTLTETNATLQRKLVELEAANQVLQQRTAALGSLQDVGQALIRSTSLSDLASRVCRHARDLCGADRAILYLAQSHGTAEILAVNGWDPGLVHVQLDLPLEDRQADSAPASFTDWPPGVPVQHADRAGFTIRAGLRVPLLANDRPAGLMIVQSTQKARFTPAEVALLQAFADQAALAIQRAELIEAHVRQERLEHELELARDVQQSLLPRRFPQVSGYTFGACNQPARQVGGDSYDVFMLDDQHIGIVIADVSGKGMPAALYMALTRSLLLAGARRERSPRSVLLSVNRLLREIGDPHLFVTVFYGVIAIATGHLTYARAGHDYPLLLRDGDVTALGGRGIVLGFFASNEIILTEEQLVLETDDRLVLYTDGLTDVVRPDGARFDLERLKKIFRSHAQLDPEALCLATFADLTAYQGSAEQFDDMTLLVIGVS